MSRFRILSIDGGGIKGLFPASFLAAIEGNLEEPIHHYFDLIAGTSTGGIIALGLAFGSTATQLSKLYFERGSQIFPAKARTGVRRIENLFRARYKTTELESALTSVLGDATLGDAQVRLLIPTMSAYTGKIHIYKTPHHPKLEMDYKVRAVDVALATSAAPMFFPAHVSAQGLPLLDGGLWANNPTGMAVVEAIAMLDADRSNIEVLSLGCTEEPRDFSKRGSGAAEWAFSAINAAFEGQSFSSMGTAYMLAGHDHVHRHSPIVAPGRFSLDNAACVQELRALGYEYARLAIDKLRPQFFSEPVAPFCPHYRVHYLRTGGWG